MLIRHATLLDGTPTDIRVGDTIEEVAVGLPSRPGEQILDARGGTVLPGLHDHHVHLRAAAVAAASVRVGPGQAAGPQELARILTGAAAGDDGWVRAIGYHDTVAGALDRHALDALAPDRPVRIQHRSGALWMLNSAGLQRIGLPGHPSGRFLRGEDDFRLPEVQPSLSALGELFSRFGVTGATDATPGQRRADIAGLAAAAREVRQRLHCMADGGVAAVPGVSLGPAKKILDDAGLDLDALVDWIAETHRRDHPVAVHCVTDSQLVVTLAALREAGVHPGDRVEHAAIVPTDCIADLADLGVTVVTQPNFVAERGDEYLAEVPEQEQPYLWRTATLVRAGVRVALSTDCPFGDPDPWAAMRAAVYRRTPSGRALGAGERISPLEAVTMFLGHADDPARPRRVAPGEPGDLCVLSLPPAAALAGLGSDMVAATVIGGELVYRC